MEILDQGRLQNAKCAFSTRRVPITAMKTLCKGPLTPKAGDLVLARVKTLGSHKRIELPTGRKAMLFPGDEIVLAYGNRYAPDQYEAYVPDDLSPCHMVAAGGIAGEAVSWHERLVGPTNIEPIGLLGDAEEKVINLSGYALPKTNAPIPAHVFAVFGTSMNAGKTTTAAAVVKGLSRLGYSVGAAKITGTGAGGDLWLMRDYGAVSALDFTDTGLPTTFGVDSDVLIQGTRGLLSALGAQGCSVAVLEVADGLYQRETSALAQSSEFQSILTGTFFAAGDAMGAVSGAQSLLDMGHNVLGISGAITCSPLAIKEVTRAVDTPVYLLSDLFNPETASCWLEDCLPALAAGQ